MTTAAATALPVTLDDIREARMAIAPHLVATPCIPSRTLSDICGAEIWVKFENLQFTASFKERGALNKLRKLTAEERARGVIAMSAGNHAQGVAYHAGRLGIPATIVMPEGTPFIKVELTEGHGARVVLMGNTLVEAAAEAERLAREEGLVFVHPYDDRDVIAGQGTVALEMLEAAPELDVLVVPIGGGGLISGIATAAKALKPGIQVVGVEVEAYPAMYQALRGLPIEVGGDTIAEGIAVKKVGALTTEIVRALVDEVVLVPDEEVERAVALFLNIEKTVAEGAGAAGLAAVLNHPHLFQGKKVGLVLCGGNIDSRLLAQVIMRQLVRESRLIAVRIVVPDRPGALGKITSLVGEAGGNIIEAMHQRLFTTATVKATDIDLTIECRSKKHAEKVVQTLREKGEFKVKVLAGGVE
ncbi:threonine ammonia-lyase [Indioceanicola profundi]|uniref:threonine ammonia-lyase n=1 Tax=Indioceanicola profundi TaxID=2220096 RepID=UPI000E6AD8C7|nr:threonine ammonia-lyase [Indioceanicola profundi]